MSINRVTVSGNLTRDPELRQTAGGMDVLGFGVAVNDRRKNSQTGEWEDVPNFIDCTMFGNRARAVSQYIRKGSKVFIEGKLRWSQWTEGDTGKKRSKLEVIVDELEFGNARNDGQQQPQQASKPVQAPQQPQAQGYAPQPPQQPQMPGMGYQQAPQPAYAPAQPQRAGYGNAASNAPFYGAPVTEVYEDEDIPF